MGISSSKIEEDKALQLCRERKKFVKQSLDGRCSLAAAHVTYIQSLKSTGIALRKFLEPEAPIESSLYTSTSATPEPLALTEKSLSQFSFSPPSISQNVYATETISPSPSPNSSQFQANHMTFRSSSSQKIEEKLSFPVTGTVTSASTPQNMTPRSTERPEASPFQGSSLPPGTPPWDYFGLFHPTDHEFSFQDGKGMYQGLENADDIRQFREEEGIPELEDEEEKTSSHEREESLDSEGEFDEPSTDTLVRSFENLNRVHDHAADNSLHSMPSAQNVALETELLNREKENSPYLSPMKATSKVVALPTDQDKAPSKEDCIESKVPPKDFFSSIRDIEFLFMKASESGKEVPRMLEANKLNFRPIFPGKESGSMTSKFLKTCFSCGEDPRQVQEEPAENSTKYLTWHRTASSRSSSTRNPLGANSKDDMEDFIGNSFENFCMNSGSHASTLDRLYAWERKLHDEVKLARISLIVVPFFLFHKAFQIEPLGLKLNVPLVQGMPQQSSNNGKWSDKSLCSLLWITTGNLAWPIKREEESINSWSHWGILAVRPSKVSSYKRNIQTSKVIFCFMKKKLTPSRHLYLYCIVLLFFLGK